MNVTTLALGRRRLLALGLGAVAGLGTLSAPALAYDPASASPLNTDKSGLAIRGYDPVAYFTDGKPTKGNVSFAATHQGATYHFASAANRDTFMKEPAKYAPQYGGFCAMGAAMGKKFDGDPNLWRVVDGKLYLNVAEGPQKRWLTDVPGFLKQANENWPKIKDKTPGTL